MNRIVIVGGGGHAKVVAAILKKTKNYDVVGYVDKADKGSILGVGYLGDDGVLEGLVRKGDVKNAAIGVGQIKDSSRRRGIVEELMGMGYSFPVLVSPHAVINEGVIIDSGTVVMDGVVVNPGTQIGSFCILNTGASIDHDCTIGDFVHICPGVTLSGGVTIGGDSLIGAGATVTQNRGIAKNCIVGAGAVVVKDCLEKGIYLGIPARLIS